MDNKGLVGIKILRVLFVVLGLYSLGNAYALSRPEFSQEQGAMVVNGAKATLEKLSNFKKEEYQEKLRKSGNMDKFNKEQAVFKQELMNRAELYRVKIIKIKKFLLVISLLGGIFSLISGFLLATYRNWVRYLSLLSVIFFGLYHFLVFSMCVYPLYRLIQYIDEAGHALSLFVDPNYPAHPLSSIKMLLFESSNVFYHMSVLIIIGSTIYYLTRPKVKEQFK